MAWIRSRRAYLIGTGAIVVALVAIGIVLHTDNSSMHRRAFFDVHRPFFNGPMPHQYEGGPPRPMPGLAPRDLPRGSDPFRPALRDHSEAGLLHGEFTVKTPRGGYQTVAVQRGTVTEVSATSITVKSADGYRATYAVTKHAAHLKQGDEVQLRASVSDRKATVTELTTLRTRR